MTENTNQAIESKTCVIAYMDILGTEDRINNESDNESQEKIHQLYNAVKWAKERVESLAPGSKPLSIKIFSDNILAYIELDNLTNYLSELDHTLFFAAFFQIASHKWCHWSVRGGITIGNIYQSKENEFDFVWGKGLIKAINLEKYANYPRVIIDPENDDLVNNVISLSKNALNNAGKQVYGTPISKFEDDLYFISYDEILGDENKPLFIDDVRVSLFCQLSEVLISKNRDNILESCPELTGKIMGILSQSYPIQMDDENEKYFKVIEKINWSIRYHNFVCDKFGIVDKQLPLSLDICEIIKELKHKLEQT